MSDARFTWRLPWGGDWPILVMASLTAVIGWALLSGHSSARTANRWLIVAVPILGYQVAFYRYHRPAASSVHGSGPSICLPTLVTMGRGHLYAATAGFLLVTPATPLLAWAPGVCYGTGAALDWLDGRLARHLSGPTALGAKLDMAFDTLGFLVAPVVGVVWGRLPVVYLSLAVARYLFRAGISWRRYRGSPVRELGPSRLRRWLAALQMAFIAIALLPLLPVRVVHPVAVIVLAPSIAMFVRDYLVVTGRVTDPAGR